MGVPTSFENSALLGADMLCHGSGFETQGLGASGLGLGCRGGMHASGTTVSKLIFGKCCLDSPEPSPCPPHISPSICTCCCLAQDVRNLFDAKE